MATDFVPAPSLDSRALDPRETHNRLRHALAIFAIATLLGLVTALVYATGGVDGPYTYIMLLPLLLGAAVYGVAGGWLQAYLAPC